MKNVKVIKGFYDKEASVHRNLHVEFSAADKRADELAEGGYVKVVDEPADTKEEKEIKETKEDKTVRKTKWPHAD